MIDYCPEDAQCRENGKTRARLFSRYQSVSTFNTRRTIQQDLSILIAAQKLAKLCDFAYQLALEGC